MLPCLLQCLPICVKNKLPSLEEKVFKTGPRGLFETQEGGATPLDVSESKEKEKVS